MNAEFAAFGYAQSCYNMNNQINGIIGKTTEQGVSK